MSSASALRDSLVAQIHASQKMLAALDSGMATDYLASELSFTMDQCQDQLHMGSMVSPLRTKKQRTLDGGSAHRASGTPAAAGAVGRLGGTPSTCAPDWDISVLSGIEAHTPAPAAQARPLHLSYAEDEPSPENKENSSPAGSVTSSRARSNSGSDLSRIALHELDAEELGEEVAMEVEEEEVVQDVEMEDTPSTMASPPPMPILGDEAAQNAAYALETRVGLNIDGRYDFVVVEDDTATPPSPDGAAAAPRAPEPPVTPRPREGNQDRSVWAPVRPMGTDLFAHIRGGTRLQFSSPSEESSPVDRSLLRSQDLSQVLAGVRLDHTLVGGAW